MIHRKDDKQRKNAISSLKKKKGVNLNYTYTHTWIIPIAIEMQKV